MFVLAPETRAVGLVLALWLTSACAGEEPGSMRLDTPADEATETHQDGVDVQLNPITFADLAGRYEIIGVRAVSLTATTIDQAVSGEDPRGQIFTIDGEGVHLGTKTCADQALAQGGNADLFNTDPMLADLRLAALDGELADGGKLITVDCGGTHFMEIYRADPRALAIPWANSSSYLIAEKVLSPGAVRQFQAELQDMKFLTGEPNEVWGEEALYALRAYYAYRDRSEEKIIFNRPAITASLLEGLRVDVD